MKCWDHSPKERPTMCDVLHMLCHEERCCSRYETMRQGYVFARPCLPENTHLSELSLSFSNNRAELCVEGWERVRIQSYESG